jgi:hypothetical protein
MITKGQIKKIKTLISRLGFDDELYRELLMSYFNTDSCKNLTKEQAANLINGLENHAKETVNWTSYNNKTRYDELENRQNMATPRQLRKIEAMWKDVSYHTDDPSRKAGLRQFLEKKCGVSDLKFLDKKQVQKIILILEDMQARKGKRYGKC